MESSDVARRKDKKPKESRPSRIGSEGAGDGGRAKSSEDEDFAEKTGNKRKRHKEKGDGGSSTSPKFPVVKEEYEDEDFAEERGNKRKKRKEEGDGHSGSSTNTKKEKINKKKMSIKEETREKIKKEGEQPTKKEKKSKEEIEEANALETEEEGEQPIKKKKSKEEIGEANALKIKKEEDDQPINKKKIKKEIEGKALKIKKEEGDQPIKKKKIKKEIDGKALKIKKEEGDQPINKKKIKKEIKGKALKIKKEEGDQPIKKKKSKEEIEEAKALKIKKKEEEEQQRWRWWEEEKYEDGVKWKFLEHKGPYFPPEYQCLPDNVRFYYNGKVVKLSPAAEEPALFFAQMLDHEYTTKDVFRKNFFQDWRKEMTHEERTLIQNLDLCDFGELHTMHKEKVEARKNLSKDEKQVIKDANLKIVDEYGYCLLDQHKERIGNFKIEPPGLFRGRGEHPKQGQLKKRIQPEDIIINCSKDSHIPEPPPGHKWKEVRHDNKVTWLVSWTENIQGSVKYIMLSPNSKLKGEKDWDKFEVARKLKGCVDEIRRQYHEDFKSKLMEIRQRAVALYFIDKLALRAGNEKEEGETADTVGCCSLRVEHVTLHNQLEGEECVVEFDFLGKDCIRYYNKVPVLKKVFKNLKLFVENKQPADDLFDRLSTVRLNNHLSSLMPGLTAKVFRTYNASITLQHQLKELYTETNVEAEKLLTYNRANRAVAILCNHQRAPPKTFDQSMANLQAKIVARKEQLTLAKSEVKKAKKEAKSNSDDAKLQTVLERKRKAVERTEEQLLRMEVQATDREENKQIALGTSKLNYLDPRISVAWCKCMDVPLDKIYNKSQRDKFAWAIDMTQEDFIF